MTTSTPTTPDPDEPAEGSVVRCRTDQNDSGRLTFERGKSAWWEMCSAHPFTWAEVVDFDLDRHPVLLVPQEQR